MNDNQNIEKEIRFCFKLYCLEKLYVICNLINTAPECLPSTYKTYNMCNSKYRIFRFRWSFSFIFALNSSAYIMLVCTPIRLSVMGKYNFPKCPHKFVRQVMHDINKYLKSPTHKNFPSFIDIFFICCISIYIALVCGSYRFLSSFLFVCR